MSLKNVVFQNCTHYQHWPLHLSHLSWFHIADLIYTNIQSWPRFQNTWNKESLFKLPFKCNYVVAQCVCVESIFHAKFDEHIGQALSGRQKVFLKWKKKSCPISFLAVRDHYLQKFQGLEWKAGLQLLSSWQCPKRNAVFCLLLQSCFTDIFQQVQEWVGLKVCIFIMLSSIYIVG